MVAIIFTSFFQKLIFKARSKSNKNCIKDTAKNKKKKNKDAEDPKIVDDREKAEKEEDKSREERVNPSDIEPARETETPKEREVRCGEDRQVDDGIEFSVETVEKKDGGSETKDKGAVNAAEGENVILDEEESKKNREVQEVADAVGTVKRGSKTKEKEDEGVAEAEAVLENGVNTDELAADSQVTATNQSPGEIQE